MNNDIINKMEELRELLDEQSCLYSKIDLLEGMVANRDERIDELEGTSPEERKEALKLRKTLRLAKEEIAQLRLEQEEDRGQYVLVRKSHLRRLHAKAVDR